MKKFLVLASSAAVALTIGGAALAHNPQGGPGGGWGPCPMMQGWGGGPGWGMGPGMMQGWGGGPGWGMGPGMMQGWGGGPGMGPGMMQGWGGGPGMGPGMMQGWGGGPGMGQGMMGWQTAEPLTTDAVTQRLQRHLAMMGNERLKIGSVTEQQGAIVAEIVTQDGALVDKLAFDKETGRPQRVD